MTAKIPSRFAQDVIRDLEELAKLDVSGAAKAAELLRKDPEKADEYDNMRVADAADLLIALG